MLTVTTHPCCARNSCRIVTHPAGALTHSLPKRPKGLIKDPGICPACDVIAFYPERQHLFLKLWSWTVSQKFFTHSKTGWRKKKENEPRAKIPVRAFHYPGPVIDFKKILVVPTKKNIISRSKPVQRFLCEWKRKMQFGKWTYFRGAFQAINILVRISRHIRWRMEPDFPEF